jgi:hypothetical protein
VRENGRIVGGEEWLEKVYNREEWNKLLRTARNCRILYMAMGWMNGEPYLWNMSYVNCYAEIHAKCDKAQIHV